MNSPSDSAVAEALLAGRLGIINARLPMALAMTVVISTVFAALLSQVLPVRPLSVWVAMMWVVSGIRFIGWNRYRLAQPGPARARYWLLWSRVGAFAAAITWSFGATYLMRVSGSYATTMLVITIMAVAAVAVATIGADFPAALGFLLLSLGPIPIELVTRAERLDQVAGLAVIASLVTLCAAAYRLSHDTGTMLRTELNMTAAVLAESDARAAAEEANAAKSAFLANMSHEVRTPLNGVLGMTDLLIASTRDVESRRRLLLLQQSANNLLAIVNDILDLSKVEAGKLEIEHVVFDVRSMLEDLAQVLDHQSRAKGVAFAADVHESVPVIAISDPARLRQVLHNLGSNAVKFTSTGRVTIRAAATATGPGSLLRVEVSDTGIGIPDVMKRKLFQPFVQGDSSTSRRYGGTGLGLAISQQLVTLLGGTIGVVSKEAHGSTFWIEVPLAASDDASGPIGLGSAPVWAQRALLQEASVGVPSDGEIFGAVDTARLVRVLLVEDNEVNQILAREVLRNAGCHVALATNGVEAINARFSASFDVVFMDCQMPVLDGLEATRRIRARELSEGARRVRIVAVTANALVGDREQFLAAGADDYLSKPYSLAGLLSKLPTLDECDACHDILEAPQ